MRKIELGYDGESNDPFAMYFVYSRDSEPVLVTGYNSEVREYVKHYYPIAIYRWTVWKNGVSHGDWAFTSPISMLHMFPKWNARYGRG